MEIYNIRVILEREGDMCIIRYFRGYLGILLLSFLREYKRVEGKGLGFFFWDGDG